MAETWGRRRVLSVAVGSVGELRHGSRTITTAFVKSPVHGPVHLRVDGLTGDEHVYEHHGGADMAALVYSADHYPAWESELGRALAVPSFGENLTVEGLTEDVVHIGDVLTMGTAVVQIAQPRTPCYKLAAAFGVKDMAVRVQESGRTGYLLRVLEEGMVEAGADVRLLQREGHGITVAEAGHIVNVATGDTVGARRLLALDTLGSAVRRTLEARLGPSASDGPDVERLFGTE